MLFRSNDGVKRTRTEIIADNMIMLDRGPSAGAGAAPSFMPPLPTVDAGAAPPVQPTNAEEIKVEDNPF